jgi:DNA-binding GntR family transcriptional regulator
MSVTPDVLEQQTLTDRVFQHIQDAIVRGEIKPGSKLSEAELATQYGVSRGPLREALSRLEARKLLLRTPNVGMRVVSLSKAELIEIYQVREVLEGFAARLAAQLMSDAEIQQLKYLLLNHQDQNELQEGRSYYQEEGDLDFHYRIVKGSQNTTLIDMLCGELYHRVRLYRYQFSAKPGRALTAFDQHKQILSAIEARDGELAELLMRRHIASARVNIENYQLSAEQN